VAAIQIVWSPPTSVNSVVLVAYTTYSEIFKFSNASTAFHLTSWKPFLSDY
jgi:hypothetical protein